MQHNLIDREKEGAFLEEAYQKKQAQLIVLYGRRRVGKSFLSSKFVNKKNGIYFLCSKGNDREQLELLSAKLADYFKDSALKLNPFTKWHDFFSYLADKLKEKPLVIEFDEFPYLINANSAIPSIFQKYWDEELSKLDIYLLLCGSSISMMETHVLGYRSPLYGRRTGQWKLNQLHFRNVMKFFDKKASLERIIETYAITGGMPYYLVILDLEKSAIHNALEHIAKKGEPLLEEGEALIREELPEALTYFSILHALSKGRTKQSEIANHVGMPATGITRYLSNLQRLGFVKKELPITENERSKKSIYSISDNFIRFWFRFIYSNRSYIEEGDQAKMKGVLEQKFRLHVSRVFEDVCMQALHIENPIDSRTIGKWWGPYRDKETDERKTAEIDIVALNEKTDEVLFAECKWKEKVDAGVVFKDLKKKALLVDWKRDKRKESYAIFAKSFKNKAKYKDVQLYDLEDLEKIFNKS